MEIPPNPSQAPTGLPSPLPLVGRRRELATLLSLLDRPGDRRENLLILSGEGGVGKSRLVEEVSAQAFEEGWTVAAGRAYPVETGIPYAVFSDAFLPLLRTLGTETLAVVSRGGERELGYLFPTLAGKRGHHGDSGADPQEFKTRLLWNFHELLGNLASRSQLLIVLEDLQWADESSLELLHFIARQPGADRLVLIGTYNDTDRDRNARLVATERSLLSLRVARTLRLEPLTHAHTIELVCRTFGVEEGVVREFCALLWGWTRGNPFFLEEVLKDLVEGGTLRLRDGTWLGWEVKEPTLPGTVRDAIVMRVQRLAPPAPALADLVAVVGTRAGYELLRALSGFPEDRLLAALEELRDRGILLEEQGAEGVVYDFVHPLVRGTLYQEMGLARARVLHGEVGRAMETHYGHRAMEHVDELAYHFRRTGERHLVPKAVHYLAAAGRQALERHADREAVAYLQAALERLEPGQELAGQAGTKGELTADLARAHQRLGEYRRALALWNDTLALTSPDDHEAWAHILHHLGLCSFWSGESDEALGHLEAALAAAEAARSDGLRARIRMVLGFCQQELGRGREALKEMEAALTIVERLGDPALLARAHRSLALLHIWISPPEVASRHAARALELAEESGDRNVAFWGSWGLAVLKGLIGNVGEMERQLARAREIAEELHSPVLRLWTDEMTVEMAIATGDWDSAIALGERSIALARSLNQHILLPRLLVLAAILYLGRHDLERGKELVDEACELAGLGSPGNTGNIHATIAAHIGLARYHLSCEDHREAIRVAEAGLEIADRTGFTLSTLHRLIPILAEAYLWLDDVEAAERLSRRMRDEGEHHGHRLAHGWADACDALIRWKLGDSAGAAIMMTTAAATLEEIPMVPEAARLRRLLAGRLAEIGDRDGALRELRRVHDLFSRMGAERELERTRVQFREAGFRPPPRLIADGPSGLTEREVEIARLVTRGKSNKAVGKELGISPRTVSTHLSNIFQKLGLGSRLELAEHVRGEGMLDDGVH